MAEKKADQIILYLFITLVFIAFIQICSLEYFHLSTLLEANRGNSLEAYDRSSSSTVSSSRTEASKISTESTSLRPLEEILHRAGVTVTEEIKEQLSPKEDVISMYGSKPIIMGLERCERFRDTVEKGEVLIGPAGMFNTGTNLLQTLLSSNCYIPDRVEKYGKQQNGVRYQVPWGKHSPVSWRYKHSAPTMTALNHTTFLPAVVIKDPYTWMDSMCRHSYAANWQHVEGHCPNLIPITPEEKEEIRDAQTYKVNIRYRDTNITHHDSLADLWNTWYGDWIDAEFPRIIVRFEDLLFHAEFVVKQVCECAGGKLYSEYSSDFKYSVDSAKQGKAHVGANGLVKSMTKYGDKEKRLKSFTEQDLSYANGKLQSDIMTFFGYVNPNNSNTTTVG